MSFSAEPTSVSSARRFVRQTLEESDASAFEEGAVLLVSELVTNAVLHARTAVEVTVRATDGRVWIGVRDGSPVTPAPKRYGADAATGRGLQLVERVAARWGVDKQDFGKVVWFELDDDSLARYEQAQQAEMHEGFAAIEMELDPGAGATLLERADQGTGPGTSSRRTTGVHTLTRWRPAGEG